MKRLADGALIIVLLLGINTARAGECTRSDEDNLRTLEQGAGIVSSDTIPKPQEVSHALYCLIYNRIDPWRWAGPRTAEYFAELRRSPIRNRLVAACIPYLVGRSLVDNGNADLTFEAATALAMCGVAESNGRDIFKILSHGDPRDPKRLPYFALASLADPRTLPFLKANYDSLTAAEPSHDTKYGKTQLVNCLYHLPGDSVVSLVRLIATTDPDSAVVERAGHVLKVRQP